MRNYISMVLIKKHLLYLLKTSLDFPIRKRQPPVFAVEVSPFFCLHGSTLFGQVREKLPIHLFVWNSNVLNRCKNLLNIEKYLPFLWTFLNMSEKSASGRNPELLCKISEASMIEMNKLPTARRVVKWRSNAILRKIRCYLEIKKYLIYYNTLISLSFDKLEPYLWIWNR